MKKIINVISDDTLLEIRKWLLVGIRLKAVLKICTSPVQLAKIKAEAPYLTSWGTGSTAIIQRLANELRRRYDRHSYVSVAQMIKTDRRLEKLQFDKDLDK